MRGRPVARRLLLWAGVSPAGTLYATPGSPWLGDREAMSRPTAGSKEAFVPSNRPTKMTLTGFETVNLGAGGKIRG